MFKQSFLNLYHLYSWHMPKNFITAFRELNQSPVMFVRWVFGAKNYRTKHRIFYAVDEPLLIVLRTTMFILIVTGITLVYWWAYNGTKGLWAFGLALLVGYPFVIAFLVVFDHLAKHAYRFILNPKKFGRTIVAIILESQVKALRSRHNFKVVAVVGSVGKTSTKLAISHMLGQELRVRYQAGNYNDRITVPLVFFGQTEPSIFNVFSWLKLFGDNLAASHHPYPYDVVVVELGTDGPGQIQEFAYLKPDITVVTAVSAEHMEQFKTMRAVAEEELSVFNFSNRVLVNADDIPGKYLVDREFLEYSITVNVLHNYYAYASEQNLEGQKLTINTPSGKLSTHIAYLGNQGTKFALAAIAVSDMLGLSHDAIREGAKRLKPFAGRLQVLKGVEGSVIIDDTYNASPLAVKAALDVLYAQKTKQRIAILGSMNELGDMSQRAHVEVGSYCDPDKLDFVVTVGEDAGRWLGPAAKRAGCEVHSFKTPYQAGEYVLQQVKKGAVILGKGSQNGVFVEEALKLLLEHPADSEMLVRQSPTWLRRKQSQFEN